MNTFKLFPKIKISFTIEDCYKAIFYEYYFQKKDVNENSSLTLSSDVPFDLTFHKSFLIEDLVQKIISNEKPVFSVERNLLRIDVKEESNLGFQLYSVLRNPVQYFQHPQCDISEHVKSFAKALKSLDIDKIMITGDPNFRHGACGTITEAELLNNLVSEIRFIHHSASTRNRVKKRKVEIDKQYAAAKRLINRLFEIYFSIYVLRFDLEYLPDHASDIDLDQAIADQNQFAGELASNPIFDFIVGHMSKRKYLTEVGYRQQFFFIVAPNHLQNESISIKQLTSLWESITLGKGQFVDARSYPSHFKKLGVGSFSISNKDRLLEDIQFWLKQDKFARLKVSKKYPSHFSISSLPKKPKPVAIQNASLLAINNIDFSLI